MPGEQRDSERTKRHILVAATDEFAALGIAGARVERIAEKAGCNKAMLYQYYGSKNGLFDAVFTAYVDAYLEEVGFDANDLPGYAGRVFDYFEEHPDHLRLATWYRLERPQGSRLGIVMQVNKARLAALEKALGDNLLPAGFTAVELLALIQSIATSWSTMNPEYGGNELPDSRGRRRSVVAAVERLIAVR